MAEILIVEDDENIAKMISITLSMDGTALMCAMTA